MQLVPFLAPELGETTVSWCTRIAMVHANLSCADWLKMMGLSRQHVMETNDYCVERLADLTGVPAPRVRECGPQRVGERLLRYGSEEFGASFMARTYTTYCPACLVEVGGDDSGFSVCRIGRVHWMFTSVRTCPVHGIELVRRRNRGYFERFQDMTIVAPEDAILEEQAAVAPSRGVSALQTYLQKRLSGIAGPAWLDGQKIDQATRACEMLGVCRLFGAHADIDNLTMAQWDDAGSVGHMAALKGSEGLHSLLDEIVQATIREKPKGGPQSALGRIYHWLQFDKSQRDPGPIRDCVRDFIVDTMSIDPGTVLFGETVVRRKRHSVATLAKNSGVHIRTLNRALVLSGLLPDGEPEKIDSRATFDAKIGEALVDRIMRSLPIKDIPAYLNCNRTQAQMLVKSALLPQVASGLSLRGGVLTNVPIDALDKFLVTFRAKGRPVVSASAGMMDVIEASEIARETVTDIVRLVLEGSLSKIEVLDETHRFRSVLVDPEEVRAVVNARENQLGMSVREAARRIGVSTGGIGHLRSKRNLDGEPFLRAIEFSNARGTIRFRYAAEEIERFRGAHILLRDAAIGCGMSSKAMSKRLTDKGIEPILEPVLLNAKIFRRADL